MKTIHYKILLIMLVSVISLNWATAQCTASFTYVDNGNGTFTFTNTFGSGLEYYWNFDGLSGYYPPLATSTIENPTYTYSTPGTYYVSLSIYDSITNCYDSTAQQIEYVMDTTCNITAGFTFVDNGGGNYSFTNTSVGENYYDWNFGDASSSSYSESPNHVFAANGTYQICMTVFDTTSSCSDNICQTITVTSVSTLCDGFSVSFTSTLNYNQSNSAFQFNPLIIGGTFPYTYSWNFGDGTIINDPGYSGYYTYFQEGIFYPELTVTDSNGCVATYVDTIIVDKCNYLAKSSYTGYTGQYFFFSTQNLSTTSSYWDFGDGNSSTGMYPTATHTYTNSGTYYYCLTIDSCPTVCDSVVIDVCDFYISAYPDSMSSNIYFSTNNIAGTSYFWDFGDGNTSTQANPNYTYSAPGTYYYCLTVDSCPTVCDSVVVVVACNVSANFSLYNFGNGNFSFYNNSGGSALNGLSAYWNFGDGNTSNTYDANHTYTTNGTYVVVLAVTDSTVYGTCMDYYTATITITDATNPVTCNAAFVMYTDSSYNGVMVVNSSTGSNLSYFWDFGDGNTSTQAYPSYTYATAGPFYLCLTVTGDSSCTSTYCDSIDAGGIVLKQNGFNINVISPITVGINDEAKEFISSLQLYPNPVRNELTIELELTNPTTVEVFVTDLLGKTVANIVNEEINVGTTKFQWNTSTTKNGIYLLNIISNHSRQVKKVVVNR